MDQLLRQLGGGQQFGGMQGLFNTNDEEEGSRDEGPLDDEQLMENIKVTYDVFIQNTLNSTTHTVQWLPYRHDDKDYSQFTNEYFLIGTHADEEQSQPQQEYIHIAKVRVPKYSNNEKNTIDYTKLKPDHSQVEIVQSFNHEFEVNKARAMPQDWKTIASLSNTGEILLYNYSDGGNNKPQDPIAKLQGLDQEGFGLSWSNHKKGLLLGASGQQICLWDINGQNTKCSIKLDQAHEKTINDGKFSILNPNLFGTASDDNNYKIWDIRELKANSFVHCYKASEDDLLVISFNHRNEYLFATGGEQSGIVNIWDLRMAKYFINDLVFHKQAVNQIEWSPFSEDIFMTSSSDGSVLVWDNSKTGEEQARHDYEDGPPEMIFPHDAHRQQNIEDISWSPNQENFVVSCDTQLRMQIWKMSDDFFFNEIDYVDRLNEINEMELE